MGALRHYMLLLVAVVSMISMPHAAYAYTPLQCDGSGHAVAQTTLYNADVAGGDCQFQGIQHVFSQVVCNFVTVLNLVLDKVYCGIQYALVGTLGMLLTLYVAVFGVQLILGTAQLNAKDTIMRLIKIGCVWGFATDSAWGINYMFTFFMSLIGDASAWVINALRDSSMVNVIDPASQTWSMQVMNTQMGEVHSNDIMPLYSFLDDIIYKAFTGPLENANTKVIGFFVAMLVAYPPLWALAWWWASTTFIALVRTVLSFLTCLAAIAFLIALSPVFLSLMLFQATNHFFENWLRYIISYSVQIVVVFAIIVLWIIVVSNFVDYFSQLADVIFPYDPTLFDANGPIVDPKDSWGICPLEYFTDAKGPNVRCLDPGFGEDWENEENMVMDMQQMIAPTEIPMQTKFIYYMIYHLVSLLVITYAFTALLKRANEIARSLSGPSQAPLLMGGWGNSGFGTTVGKKTPAMLRPSDTTRDMVDNMSDMVTDR